MAANIASVSTVNQNQRPTGHNVPVLAVPPYNDVMEDVNDTVTINVGGMKHDVARKTLKKLPQFKLNNLDNLQQHYRKGKDEYYFDRHPGVFTAVLSFCRTGELHVPNDLCGTLIKLELDYWGINELDIEMCCWIRYKADIDTKSTLRLFDERMQTMKGKAEDPNLRRSAWESIRFKMWRFFDIPRSSVAALVYAMFSILVVLLSITIFCAETHPYFKVNMTANQYAEYYGVDTKTVIEDWGAEEHYSDYYGYWDDYGNYTDYSDTDDYSGENWNRGKRSLAEFTEEYSPYNSNIIQPDQQEMKKGQGQEETWEHYEPDKWRQLSNVCNRKILKIINYLKVIKKQQQCLTIKRSLSEISDKLEIKQLQGQVKPVNDGIKLNADIVSSDGNMPSGYKLDEKMEMIKRRMKRAARLSNNTTKPPPPPEDEKYSREDELLSAPNPILEQIDFGCIAFFTLELIVRFICAPNRKQFCLSVLNIIDVLSILPFAIIITVESFNPEDKYRTSAVDALYILKVLRVFRIFRLVRHNKGLRVLLYTFRQSWKEMMLLLLFMTIGMIIFASLVYYFDHESGQFPSIPFACWWAVVTMTTLGYGDVYPKTSPGYLVGAICAVSGVLVIAFTVPSIVNNFLLFYNHVQYEKVIEKVDGTEKKLHQISVISLEQEKHAPESPENISPRKLTRTNSVGPNSGAI